MHNIREDIQYLSPPTFKDQIYNEEETKEKECIPTRISISFLCLFGVIEIYLSRTIMSIAIVAMVQIVSPDGANSQDPREPYCLINSTNSQRFYTYDNVTEDNNIQNFTFKDIHMTSKNPPPIKMTTTERGNILSAFFYAYGFSGILGGRLSEIYGSKIVFGSALLVDTLGNFLTPVAFKTNYWLLIFVRAVMGFFQGMCYPSLHSLQPKWIPPKERSRFVGFVYHASNIGSAITLLLSGIIISTMGWENTFYVWGSVSLVCFLLWITLMYNDPSSHPRISEKEKRFIMKSIGNDQMRNKPLKVPILKILGSLPLWATNIAHCGSMFGLNFLLTQLPLYMSSVIGVNIRRNGVLSSLPFFGRYFGSNFFSWFSNYLMGKVSWHPKTWKIINSFISFVGTGTAILIVAYVGCNSWAALVLFVFAMVCNGATAAGYLCSHLDNAPNFSGTAQGISTSLAFLYSMIGPVTVGALTPQETLEEWTVVYWIVFANYIVTGGFYCLFMSTDVQPWNNDVIESSENQYCENEVILKSYVNSNDKFRCKTKENDLL